jgi:glycosyltransferase involved in cell wall biosynthesis
MVNRSDWSVDQSGWFVKRSGWFVKRSGRFVNRSGWFVSRGDDHPTSAPDAVTDEAISRFRVEYRSGPVNPICVVIPAFDEADSVAAVVRSIPASVCGLATETIVVDDGSGDATSEQARAAGAMVCRLEANLGQGRALRAGYQLALERGASYIVTLDGDGQSNGDDLPSLVKPLADGRADFVNGSRRLGRTEARARVRYAGVVVFARVITFLTGTTVTDPANPSRAFSSDVARRVTLRQDQYQSAELLTGAILHGFRVVEVPVTVHRRTTGASKKGPDLIYGWRFTRAVFRSWWSARRDAAIHR